MLSTPSQPGSRPAAFRRLAPPVALAGAAAVFLVSILPGCGGDAEPEFPELKVREPEAARLTASVSGLALFEGTPPKRRRIEMPDAWCRSQESETLSEEVVVQDGKLRDVLVVVKKGLEAWTFGWEKTPAVLNQRHCTYVPHVLAVRTRQPVLFRSEDGTAHNVNLRSRVSESFNRTVNGPGDEIRHQFTGAELSIPTVCNIHPWMQAWIHVVDHPYFAVTGDDGRFELPRKLPAGTYTLAAIHPSLGTQEAEITLSDGESATREFRFRRN